jgi:hypothetical protein
MIYFGLCGMMTNFIEENVLPNRELNQQKVKLLTNQLFQELQKPIDKFFMNIKDDPEYDAFTITEQLHIATIAMEHFFRLSLQIEDMDEMRKQGLATQINVLLLSYGLEPFDIPYEADRPKD